MTFANKKISIETLFNANHQLQKYILTLMQNKQSKLNHQLEDKFKYDESFRAKMLERQIDFKQAKAILPFQQDLKISQDILEIFSLQSHADTFFYYAFMQPKQKSMTPQLTLFLIKNFNPRLNIDLQKFHKKYKFVFFNNCVDNNQIYYEFKNIFLTLPIDYFLALDEFIFVRPSIAQKLSQWWVSEDIQKFFKAKTRYVNSIAELCPILGTTISKLIEFLPKKIVTAQFPEEASNIPQRPRKLSNHRMNVEGQSRTLEQQKQFDIFVMEMGTFFQNSKKQPLQIDEYETNEVKLPYILEELFSYFDEHPEKIKQEGLFRKSVSIDEENQTLEQLMKSNFSCLKTVTNPHLIANLIKRFFAKLKTPIIPYNSFEALMHDQGIMDKLGLVIEQVSLLPPKNYFPLMFLFEFLIEKVLPMEKYTKMNANGLAICFAPCLLKSQKPSQLDLIYATKSSHVVKLILDNFESVFGTKAERQNQIKIFVQNSRNKWEQDLRLQIKSLSSRDSKSSRSNSNQ